LQPATTTTTNIKPISHRPTRVWRKRAVSMGGATGGVWGVRRTPHFCDMYPAGGTTQFTLYMHLRDTTG